MDNFRTIAAAKALAAGALSTPAWAQNYPIKPIRILQPGVAGSAGDMRVRQVAQKLNEALG